MSDGAENTGWPPTFTIDQARVLELFIGERFYSSADAAVREAIVNALDACERRAGSGTESEASVNIVFDAAASRIVISDNGDGMDEEAVATLFARVGASASQLATVSADEQHRAVGRFGIGVISYFLVCDSFEIHTRRDGQDPIGLEFSRSMLDGRTPARVLSPSRTETGTTLVLPLKSADLLAPLVARFPYWVRDAPAVVARSEPGSEPIPQGGSAAHSAPVEVETPDWIQVASVGPPTSVADWDKMDGRAHVELLLRGIYVSSLAVDGLWGVSGSISIDPAWHGSQPQLNREGFLGDELRNELARFLQRIHPAILIAAAASLRRALADPEADSWAISRLITLWLGLPRTDPYESAAAAWDAEFSKRRAFRLLQQDEESKEISIADLEGFGDEPIYIAPTNYAGARDSIRQAVRVLRARGDNVVVGFSRDVGYLSGASFPWTTTTDLLLQQFRGRLPTLTRIEDVADSVIQQNALATIYEDSPRVLLVPLGSDGSPALVLGNEIWINVDSDVGREMARELCDMNAGAYGVILAFLRHQPDLLNQTARLLPHDAPRHPQLGLVRRQYLRRLLR